MANRMNTLVLIVSSANRPLVRQFGGLLGFFPQTYTVGLSSDGSWPPTHWGLNTTASDAFVGLVQGTDYSILPGGVPKAQAQAIRSLLLYGVGTIDDYGSVFFDQVVKSHGLQRAYNPENDI